MGLVQKVEYKKKKIKVTDYRPLPYCEQVWENKEWTQSFAMPFSKEKEMKQSSARSTGPLTWSDTKARADRLNSIAEELLVEE